MKHIVLDKCTCGETSYTFVGLSNRVYCPVCDLSTNSHRKFDDAVTEWTFLVSQGGDTA